MIFMQLVVIVGLAASILITLAYVPQVLHTIKLKHMKGISLTWLVVLVSGSFLYLVYGLLLPSLPNIISSLAITVMGSILLYHKIRYK